MDAEAAAEATETNEHRVQTLRTLITGRRHAVRSVSMPARQSTANALAYQARLVLAGTFARRRPWSPGRAELRAHEPISPKALWPTGLYAHRPMSLKVYRLTVVRAYRSRGSQAYRSAGLRA